MFRVSSGLFLETTRQEENENSHQSSALDKPIQMRGNEQIRGKNN